eukprot:795038-Rhodomonas_salina.1
MSSTVTDIVTRSRDIVTSVPWSGARARTGSVAPLGSGSSVISGLNGRTIQGYMAGPRAISGLNEGVGGGFSVEREGRGQFQG